MPRSGFFIAQVSAFLLAGGNPTCKLGIVLLLRCDLSLSATDWGCTATKCQGKTHPKVVT